MQKIATPQDLRSELHRILALASGEERPSRRVLASELRQLAARLIGAMEHPSEKAKKKYLQDHPDADPRNHVVEGKGDGDSKGKEEGDGEDQHGLKKSEGARKKALPRLNEAMSSSGWKPNSMGFDWKDGIPQDGDEPLEIQGQMYSQGKRDRPGIDFSLLTNEGAVVSPMTRGVKDPAKRKKIEGLVKRFNRGAQKAGVGGLDRVVRELPKLLSAIDKVFDG